MDITLNDVARAVLDITVAAMKSALQRARARMQDVAPTGDEIIEPTEALRHDTALVMVGSRTWFAGMTTCLPYLAGVVGVQGDWRMAATAANGQPAAGGVTSRSRGKLAAAMKVEYIRALT
jgi:RNA polymerase sigma-70 factor, ECF subfamily